VYNTTLRVFPAVVLHYSVGAVSHTAIWDVIVDGIFMSVLTTGKGLLLFYLFFFFDLSSIFSDIMLSRMAQRELHPWVVLMAMLSIFHNLGTLMLCLFYFGMVFTGTLQDHLLL